MLPSFVFFCCCYCHGPSQNFSSRFFALALQSWGNPFDSLNGYELFEFQFVGHQSQPNENLLIAWPIKKRNLVLKKKRKKKQKNNATTRRCRNKLRKERERERRDNVWNRCIENRNTKTDESQSQRSSQLAIRLALLERVMNVIRRNNNGGLPLWFVFPKTKKKRRNFTLFEKKPTCGFPCSGFDHCPT